MIKMMMLVMMTMMMMMMMIAVVGVMVMESGSIGGLFDVGSHLHARAIPISCIVRMPHPLFITSSSTKST